MSKHKRAVSGNSREGSLRTSSHRPCHTDQRGGPSLPQFRLASYGCNVRYSGERQSAGSLVSARLQTRERTSPEASDLPGGARDPASQDWASHALLPQWYPKRPFLPAEKPMRENEVFVWVK